MSALVRPSLDDREFRKSFDSGFLAGTDAQRADGSLLPVSARLKMLQGYVNKTTANNNSSSSNNRIVHSNHSKHSNSKLNSQTNVWVPSLELWAASKASRADAHRIGRI